MYYTVREFLDEYPMGRTTFYKLVNDGHLPITKFGRSTRISKAHASAWAETLPTFSGSAANDNDRA